MSTLLDYPQSLWSYFRDVDQRLAGPTIITPKPADLPCHNGDLSNIRAVLWDIYGTLCGAGVGDMESSMNAQDRLEAAAQATINEFHLQEALATLYPNQTPGKALSQRYVQLIDQSHQRSHAMGVSSPEVVIENIWKTVIDDLSGVGYRPIYDEPTLHTAYRWGYFFDSALQKTSFYPGACECLCSLKQAGIIQGIISNAQFYTPIHLRRLIRATQQRDDLQLQDIFDDSLILFSYQLGYSKPNLAAFQIAKNILAARGVTAEQILYVGNDMLNDVWCASQVGMQTVFFAGDQNLTVSRKDEPRCANLRLNAIVIDIAKIAQFILTQ